MMNYSAAESSVEVIAQAPSSDDKLRDCGIILYLFAQAAHGYIDGAHIAYITLIVPDVLHQSLPGKDLSGLGGQKFQ